MLPFLKRHLQALVGIALFSLLSYGAYYFNRDKSIDLWIVYSSSLASFILCFGLFRSYSRLAHFLAFLMLVVLLSVVLVNVHYCRGENLEGSPVCAGPNYGPVFLVIHLVLFGAVTFFGSKKPRSSVSRSSDGKANGDSPPGEEEGMSRGNTMLMIGTIAGGLALFLGLVLLFLLQPKDKDVEWVYSEPAGVWFTRSEITVDQYRACVNAGDGCTSPNMGGLCNWDKGDRGNHPINCIDWHQAKAVCEWLGGRLPTEDEWYAEASNGGTREYPWGDQQVTCDYAVWSQGGRGCDRDSTWPVCSKPRGNSVSGLCDMGGNVWEWTDTTYDNKAKVVRGGSWTIDKPGHFRASHRVSALPSKRHFDGGVRCARGRDQ